MFCNRLSDDALDQLITEGRWPAHAHVHCNLGTLNPFILEVCLCAAGYTVSIACMGFNVQIQHDLPEPFKLPGTAMQALAAQTAQEYAVEGHDLRADDPVDFHAQANYVAASTPSVEPDGVQNNQKAGAGAPTPSPCFVNVRCVLTF